MPGTGTPMLDRLLTVTDAASNVTTYAYDTESNLTSIKDANNHSTSFTYDAFGRVTKTTFPSALVETYTYDANNNLTSKTDRKNQLISYTYDNLNRLKKKSYPDASTVTYTYDNDSRLTQVVDPTGTYAFTFDNMGRLIGTSTSYSFLTARSFTESYAYDKASNRVGFTDPEGGSTAYAYDTLNRLTTLTPPSAFTTGNFGFSYDAVSRRTQMTRPNSVTTSYTYDSLSHLQSVLHKLAGSTIDGASYTLDNAGNRTAKTDQKTAVATSYGYDSIYQLLSATQGATTTESYAYDAVGNRTSSHGVASYTTNSSNEITANSNASFAYDSNGNLLTSTIGPNTTAYAWDFENRLTSVTLPGSGGTVTFAYDPFGRRINKVVSSTGATSVFAYDGDNLIDETNSSGTVVARYSQTQNIDEPLAMLRGGATSYYHSDGLGSITALSDGTGSIGQTYGYDSFGKLIASTGSLTNSFRYTGREFDPETGVYNYRARYYDQTAGRLLSEDPIGFGGGPNLYRYVSNNPLNLTDPFGLFPTWWHKQVTGQLALVIFGPKCAAKAQAVADANAAVDNFNYGIGWGWAGSAVGILTFFTHTGAGWAQPGAHFPTQTMLNQLHDKAISSCSLSDLGQSLHSRQDSVAHGGWSSFDHYFHGSQADNRAAGSDLAQGAMTDTIRQLTEFKEKCLKCCQ